MRLSVFNERMRERVRARTLSDGQSGESGVIRRTVIPAHSRVTGKERGEWMKLTDEEAALVERHRALSREEPKASSSVSSSGRASESASSLESGLALAPVRRVRKGRVVA